MRARRAPGDLRRRGSQRRSRSGRPPAPAGKAKGRCVVIGAGKASVAMAALDAAWRDVDLTGVVVTRYGQGAPAGRIAVIAAPPLALSAAADAAAKAGLTSLILGNAIEREPPSRYCHGWYRPPGPPQWRSRSSTRHPALRWRDHCHDRAKNRPAGAAATRSFCSASP